MSKAFLTEVCRGGDTRKCFGPIRSHRFEKLHHIRHSGELLFILKECNRMDLVTCWLDPI